MKVERKRLAAVVLLLSFLCVCGCGKDNAEPQAETGGQEIADLSEKKEAEEGIMVAYQQNEDGTWNANGNTYKYRLILSGRMPQAEKDTTFTVLSNTKSVTFNKAANSIISSNSNDQFDEKETMIVDMQ